jgi:hypothetical protein
MCKMRQQSPSISLFGLALAAIHRTLAAYVPDGSYPFANQPVELTQ